MHEAEAYGNAVDPAEAAQRIDLRGLPLVTIDGEDAKDFDDAVYAEPHLKGFRLIVAIADVSYYVRRGTALDACARERGTSVYFPTRVIPMLPFALSNVLCSLQPDVDRLCMRRKGETLPQGKQRCRAKFAAKGFTLIANVGNNPTDFVGGGYEKAYRLPNYGGQLG